MTTVYLLLSLFIAFFKLVVLQLKIYMYIFSFAAVVKPTFEVSLNKKFCTLLFFFMAHLALFLWGQLPCGAVLFLHFHLRFQSGLPISGQIFLFVSTHIMPSALIYSFGAHIEERSRN